MNIPHRMAVLIALLTLGSASALSQHKTPDAERELFSAVNKERKAHGLPSLRSDEALANVAREHAQRMAKQGTVSHQLPGEPSLPSRAKAAGSLHVALRKRGRGTKSNRHSPQLHEVSPAPRQHPG
jgi:uncharacterized protein YkwD